MALTKEQKQDIIEPSTLKLIPKTTIRAADCCSWSENADACCAITNEST